MAQLSATYELPTGRQSHYIPHLPHQDIYDPNWIPVLNNDYRKHQPSEEKEVSPYNESIISPLPARTTSLASPMPEARPKVAHNYSKSSLAPESVTLEPSPLPSLPSTKFGAQSEGPHPQDSTIRFEQPAPKGGRTSGNGSVDDDQNTTSSDTAPGSSSAPSTIGTASLMEEQHYSLSDHIPHKQAATGPIAHSTRSSIASARKSTATIVPTSKYSRKPVPSLPRSIMTLPSRPHTPPESPKESPKASPKKAPSEPASMPPNGYAEIGPPPTPSIPRHRPPPEPPQSTARQSVATVKSTFSQRKQRALNSHPSNMSLKSRRNSTSSEDAPPSKPPSVYLRPRKSTDSRMTGRSSLFDSQMPSPAPTTPLPELPPQARRPSLSNTAVPELPPQARRPSLKDTALPELPPQARKPSLKESAPQRHSPPQVPALLSPKPNDHPEMASFMTSTNKVVFRRFDEVHVRLLLCLQDEISQLEKDLLALDNASLSKEERSIERSRLMTSLRRVVAEYDHLFANWSSMKANPASANDMRELKQWLETPLPGALVLSRGASDDLQVLEKSRDLSSVSLIPKTADSSSPPRKSIDVLAAARPKKEATAKTTAGVGGVAAFFSCASKRK